MEDPNMKNVIRGMFFVLFIFLFFTTTVKASDINVSAAASLREVITTLSANYSKIHPDVSFKNNFAASGALAKQIENGAPADIFFSANVEWMDHLKDKGLLDKKNITTLAYNTLVFVGKPNPNIKAMQDIVIFEKIAIGSPKSVPAGQYATEAIKKAGIEKQIAGKLVMAKDVRECLMYADRGEVNGAFVYRTDAEQLAKNVKILFSVPQEYCPRVTYPVALTAVGSKKAEAESFYKYLQSSEAKEVILKYGFMVK
jgi:molybdate transport system substrate-binding protein